MTIESVFNEYLGKEFVEFEWWKFLGISFGFSILGGLAVIALFYLLLCIIGFTCCGIRAGSCAACCHSSIGDVEAGSCLSRCQSAGAGGMACCFNILLFLVGFFAIGAGLILSKVNHDTSHGGNSNSTMNATVLMADLAVNTTVLFMKKTVLLMNSSMVHSL